MSVRQCLRRSTVTLTQTIRPAVRSSQLTAKWTMSSRARIAAPSCNRLASRAYATAAKSEADEKMELIQDQYATAKDEFEIAVEETEKKTVYAAEDRAAAAEELQKLKDLYENTMSQSSPDVAAEVARRAGQRIRELDEAIKGLEASAMED